jgi:hypothetical protein
MSTATQHKPKVLPLMVVVPLKSAEAAQALQKQLLLGQDLVHQALDKVGTVHFARFVFLDSAKPGLAPAKSFAGPGPFSLAIITEFNAPYDTYIEAFANILTDAFSMIIMASSDGAELQLRKTAAGTVEPADMKKFLAYVKAHDLARHQPNSSLELYIGDPYTAV